MNVGFLLYGGGNEQENQEITKTKKQNQMIYDNTLFDKKKLK